MSVSAEKLHEDHFIGPSQEPDTGPHPAGTLIVTFRFKSFPEEASLASPERLEEMSTPSKAQIAM